MNKRIPCFLLSVLALGALGLQAQTPAPAPEPASSYSITADFPYTTKYVFRGYKLATGAFQPSIKLTSGDFYAGVWMSAPVERNWELEIDYYAGYGFKLAEGWTADVGLTAYSYPGLDTSGGADKTTFEGYFGVNGTIGVLTSGTYAYYDFTLKAFTIQQTLGYSVAVDEKTSVNFLATIGHVSPDVSDSYTYYGFGFTVPYKLTDKATITAGLQYASHDLDGVDDNHVWGTLGFTYTF